MEYSYAGVLDGGDLGTCGYPELASCAQVSQAYRYSRAYHHQPAPPHAHAPSHCARPLGDAHRPPIFPPINLQRKY